MFLWSPHSVHMRRKKKSKKLNIKPESALRPVFNWWKNIFMLLTISWDVVKNILFLLNNLLNANPIHLSSLSLKVLMNKQSTYLGSRAHTKKKSRIRIDFRYACPIHEIKL
ncbi:hypothetical protein ACKWTF_001116 [Chironomus riparius]